MATTLTRETPQQGPPPVRPLEVIASTVVVFTLAVAHPILDLLGRHTEFLVAHDARAVDVILLTVALTLLLPLGLGGAAVVAARRWRRAGVAAHYGLLAVLSGVMFLQLLIRVPAIDRRAGLAFLLAAAAGAAATAYYHSSPGLRRALQLGLLAPVALAGMFLLGSPAAGLVLGDSGDDTSHVVGNPAPVVMIVLDELPVASLLTPDGDIDGDRFPNFARLAGTSTWFRDATTSHHSTTMAVPALLTGRRAPQGALPVARDHPHNLFDVLEEQYEFHVIEPLTDLCPTSACGMDEGPGTLARLRGMAADLRVVGLHMVLPQRLSERLPAIDEGWTGFGDEHEAVDGEDFRFELRVEHARLLGETALVDRFVASLEPSSAPTLHFLHVLLPHAPWRHLPGGEVYGPARTVGRVSEPEPGWSRDAPLVHHSYQRHLWQLMYTDRLLGQVLDRLEAIDRYDDSLVVLTADHGIAFRPGMRHRRADEETLAEIAAVPLFVKFPGQPAGQVVEEPVQLIDVLPTIVSALDIEGVPAMEGRAQYPEPRPTTTRTFTTAGEPTLTFGALTPDLLEVAARKERLFGSGLPDLATTLPHADILGAATGALPVEEPVEPWRVFVGDMDTYRDLSLDGELPAVVRGRLYPPEGIDGRTLVAIAMNGEIVTLAQLVEFDDEPSARFYGLVTAEAFREGDNDLRVFAIQPGEQLRLLEATVRN